MPVLPHMRLLVGLILVLALGPVEGAFAHAQLLSTHPADTAILDVAPDRIELIFNEPVAPLAIRLIQPDGAETDLTGTAMGGATTEISMPPDMASGTHVLSWRVVSSDGHPIGGALVFSVGQPGAAATAEAAGDPLLPGLLWAGKALLFLAMFVGLGGAAFAALAPLPPLSRLLSKSLAGAGLVLAPATLGLQGLDALGLPAQSFFEANVWRAGLATSYGATVIAAVLAFAGGIVALALPKGKRAALLGLSAAALAALSLALSGHASAASPQWIARPAVFLHIAGVLFWVGALLPLWLALRDRTGAGEAALASFSKGIPFAVAPLAVSGFCLALLQMGAPGPHWLSAYGYILGAKLILLTVLSGLAVWNRYWLTAPTLAGDALARHRLRRSIGWEMALVLLILGLVAFWRLTPPPRALADMPALSAADPITVHLIDGTTMAMVTLTPGSAGPVAVDIVISDIEHVPKDVLGVTMSIGNPERGIEPIRRAAIEDDGLWRVDGLALPVAGTWQLAVEVRVSRFELAIPSGDVVIP